MGRPKKGSEMKEKSDEDFKAMPPFHKQFYYECRKRAMNESERQLIDKFFREATVMALND
jgi:hypothetical protein